MQVKISTLLLGQRFSFFQGGTVYEIIDRQHTNIEVQAVRWIHDQSYTGWEYYTPITIIDFILPGNPAHLPVIIQ